MRNNRCKSCGSKDFRADRALAGRLVCATCGNPLGTRVFNSKYPSGKYIGLNKSVCAYIIFFTVVLLIIINR